MTISADEYAILPHRGSYTKQHVPRVIPKPTGPRTLGRDPWSGLIAQYDSDPAFVFWRIDEGTGEPIKRAPLDAAWRCGCFSPETQWARIKQQTGEHTQ